MKKLKIFLIFIVLAFIIGLGIFNYDRIISYLGFPTRGLEYTLNEEGTSYSVKKGKMRNVEKLIIPSTYKELPVTIIENSAFMNCSSIIEVEIPDSITAIGDEAFLGCKNLKEIIIPNTVLDIGKGSFFGCTNLKYYSSPFSGSGVEGKNYIGFVFGASLSFDNASFVPKSLEIIKITSDSKPIDPYGFAFLSNLKEISIIETQKNINVNILHKCDNIERISLPLVIPGVSYLFGGNIPDSLKYFNLNNLDNKILFGSFFKDCKGLISVNIPESIEYIEPEAFKGCISLKYIYIPKSVFYLGDNAFDDCPNIEINCQVLSKPIAWSNSWNPDNQTVVWGAISKK